MRLAVLADIHGNLPALEAVIADMAGRRVDATVNLGDCVSGPLWPGETLERLRREAWPTVRGNHDRWVGDTSQAANLDFSDRYAYADLTPSGRAWLKALPVTLDLGSGIVAFHARPRDDNAYLLEEQWGERLVPAEPAIVARRLGSTGAALVLTGHSHVARILKIPEGPWILNPGSVGCPAYDDDSTDPPHVSEQGSPAARYAVVEPRGGDFVFELLSVPYDHASAAARAEANGRPEWALALRTGFALRSGASS